MLFVAVAESLLGQTEEGLDLRMHEHSPFQRRRVKPGTTD